MLVIEGIKALDGEESARLLVMLKSLTFTNALKLETNRLVFKSKKRVAGTARKASYFLKKYWREGVQLILEEADFSCQEITEIMQKEEKRARCLSHQEINREILKELAKLASYQGKADHKAAISRKIMVEAAKGWDIIVEGYSQEELEEKIFKRYLEKLLLGLEEELEAASEEEIQGLISRVDDSLGALGPAQGESIRRVLGLSGLTGESVVKVFTDRGRGLMSQLNAREAGPGLFFITSTMANTVYNTALSSTFPRVFCTALTSAFSFVLAPFGLFMLTGGIGSAYIWKSSRDYNRRVLSGAVALLRCSRLSPGKAWPG